MNLAKCLLTLLLILLFGQGLSAREDHIPLSSEEECVVTLMTMLNTVMAGLSRDSDEQMQRLANQASEQMENEEFKQELVERCGLDFPNAGRFPADRQNVIVEIVTCRYRDLLASEYERDGLAIPQRWTAICKHQE